MQSTEINRGPGMITDPELLSGIARVRVHFLSLLEERQVKIADNVLAAWEASSAAVVQEHLSVAQNVLHQISGTAGSLGFGPFGELARECESEIITYLDDRTETNADGLFKIIAQIDAFILSSQELGAEQG